MISLPVVYFAFPFLSLKQCEHVIEVTEEGGWVDRGGAFIEHNDTNIISYKSLPLPLISK